MQKVLVAHGDAGESARLARELRERGHEVVAANDAVHALRVAREAQPDVVLLSARLAGGGAAVALRRIRSNVFTANIPVVALAERAAACAELLDAGAQECVDPSDSDALHAALERQERESLDFTQAPAQVIADPARMSALEETRLLDSPREASFDRLTRLVTRLIGAPTALVTLVDRDRQFFKSQAGLAEPWATERQTALTHSFCQWVVSGDEALCVADAREHPVLRSNLAIRQLGVTAYAGMPLHGRDGHAIGSICAIDGAPRAWSEDDLATLRDLALVFEAYARLEHAWRASATPALAVSVAVAGRAVQGATNVLRRYGERIGAEDREELLAILDEQASHLVKLAP